MKKRVVLLVGLALIELPVAAQNGVFRCTDSGGAVAYQGSPCGVQSAQVTLVEPRKQLVGSVATAAPLKAESSEARSVFVGEELVPGMSDTRVLNMRGWGRPQHIARSRAEDGWREEWTYVSRADGATRLVQFVNGKVADVRSQDAQQSARIEPQPRIDAPQIVQALPRPQTLAIQAVDSAARAVEAAKVVERMARGDTPAAPAANRWANAPASGTEARSAPPPVEPDTGATQTEADRAGQPTAVVQSPSDQTSRRERLHVIRTDPPAPDAPQPGAVIQSSAYPPFPVDGDQTVQQ